MASDIDLRTYIRILPESDGDRVGFFHTWNVSYIGRTRVFAVDEEVTGATSGTIGRVLKDTADPDAANTGILSIILNEGYEDAAFNASESLQVNSSTIATTDNTGYCIYIPRTTLSGGNNPHNLQFIDNRGQAYIRFAEGAPHLDAFGRMQVSNAQTVAEYTFPYDNESEAWQTDLTGGGTSAFEEVTRTLLLSTGTTLGDEVKMTTHLYHPYQTSKSQLIEFALVLGDTGKANVDRIWGYGDANDGLFFYLNGTVLNVLMRSSTGIGNMTIAQSAWNTDRLDGTGGSNNISGYTLDLSKGNIYWIDFQWSVGRARFGVIIDGQRVTAHEMNHANNYSQPYMRSGSLPIYVEQLNTGTAGSTSEMRLSRGTVESEGPLEPEHTHFSYPSTSPVVVSAGASSTYMGSFRSKETFASITNRMSAYGELIDFYIPSTGDPVIVELVKNPTLTGASWNVDPHSDSSVEMDVSATVDDEDGRIIKSLFCIPGAKNELDLTTVFGPGKEYMVRHADATGWDHYTFRARTIDSPSSANVYMISNWMEFQ